MTALRAHLGGELYLPPGYYLELGADILILRREDGFEVAAFSAGSASPGEVARTAGSPASTRSVTRTSSPGWTKRPRSAAECRRWRPGRSGVRHTRCRSAVAPPCTCTTQW